MTTIWDRMGRRLNASVTGSTDPLVFLINIVYLGKLVGYLIPGIVCGTIIHDDDFIRRPGLVEDGMKSSGQ